MERVLFDLIQQFANMEPQDPKWLLKTNYRQHESRGVACQIDAGMFVCSGPEVIAAGTLKH